jgi:hypothetical protein
MGWAAGVQRAMRRLCLAIKFKKTQPDSTHTKQTAKPNTKPMKTFLTRIFAAIILFHAVSAGAQTNTFLGGAAHGAYPTAGVNNTAIGYTSMYWSYAGSYNTAVGVLALAINSAGYYNTALGHAALYSTTGSYNTGTGVQVLYYNSTGQYNTANGLNSMYYNTTGNQNTAVGAYTLFGAGGTNGSNNTALGGWAGQGISTGSNNTLIGLQAGNALTTGSGNIALGFQAGSNAIVAGNNNIHIGHVGVAGDSNTIRLGDGVTQAHTYLTGVVHSTKPVRIAPAGDLSMGAFTNGFLP